MQTNAAAFEQYLDRLPEDRREAMKKLRQIIIDNLPEGFSEKIGASGIGYSVPHALYPKGYHCNPQQPLPFLGVSSQKNFISFHHMGIYADAKLFDWFTNEYPKHSKAKLDMGKSCIRFKKMEHIPFELIGALVGKVTPREWITTYESIVFKTKIKD